MVYWIFSGGRKNNTSYYSSLFDVLLQYNMIHLDAFYIMFTKTLIFIIFFFFFVTGAVGDGGESAEDKEKNAEAERERLEAIREAEERRKEKHRKMEEEREKMRQEIRDKVK